MHLGFTTQNGDDASLRVKPVCVRGKYKQMKSAPGIQVDFHASDIKSHRSLLLVDEHRGAHLGGEFGRRSLGQCFLQDLRGGSDTCPPSDQLRREGM